VLPRTKSYVWAGLWMSVAMAGSTAPALAGCAWYPNASARNAIWACDQPLAQRKREKARAEAMKREDYKPLQPIINNDSGAFGSASAPQHRAEKWRLHHYRPTRARTMDELGVPPPKGSGR
jgi:hypothetical protein